MHGGYSRYYTPPPFELVGSETFTKFSRHLGGAARLGHPGHAADRRARQLLRSSACSRNFCNNTLTLGVDSFYEQAQHLIDEGQFGAPDHSHAVQLSLRSHRRRGIHRELLGAAIFPLTANLSFQAAHGKEVESSQFNFSQENLAYIADNYIHLDHEGRVAASGGVSYLWLGHALQCRHDLRYRTCVTI